MVKERKESEDLSSSDESLKDKKVVEKPVQSKWSPKQVFVSGLPYETTEEELKEFFGDIAKDI
jgi:RNA recognition motif-containing protein